MEKEIPWAVLSSGEAMPVLGMGTAANSVPSDLTATLLRAIECGYRHFDTAALYGTEQALGLAVSQALDRGLIASRSDIFVTSKLWCADVEPVLVIPALKKSLKNLRLEYLDLYLVHWPAKLKNGRVHRPLEEEEEEEPFDISCKWPCNKEDLLPLDIRSTWEAMEQCYKLGLAKSIGVSNFSTKKLSQLLEHATIPPAVNQVEMSASWHQKKMREFCSEKGIHVTAYSPLGANGALWGSAPVMQSPALKEIATAKGKMVSQVALRWLYQQGVSIVVKSFDKERMKENLRIFDWQLNEDELKMIQSIPQKKGVSGHEFVSADGPFKSLEELWDGEI